MSSYNLDAIIEQKTEALGGEDVIFVFKDTEFRMPHPLLADDEWTEGLKEIDETDNLAFCQYILGEEQYEKFQKLGGRSGYISMLYERIVKDFQAVSDKGNPTRQLVSSRAQKRQPKPIS